MFARKMPPQPRTHHKLLLLCLCAIFGRFSCWFMQNCGIFQLHFHSSCRTCYCCCSSCASFTSPRFALSSPCSPYVCANARACVCVCEFYTIFTHLRNCAFKCATHCHVYCCCSCSFALLVYAQPLLSQFGREGCTVWAAGQGAENRTNVGSFFARVANCIWLPSRTSASVWLCVRVSVCLSVCVRVCVRVHVWTHGSTDACLVSRIYCQSDNFCAGCFSSFCIIWTARAINAATPEGVASTWRTCPMQWQY